jgi:hypothetical protein
VTNGINCFLICDQFRHNDYDEIIINLDCVEYHNCIGDCINKFKFEKMFWDLFRKPISLLSTGVYEMKLKQEKEEAKK